MTKRWMKKKKSRWENTLSAAIRRYLGITEMKSLFSGLMFCRKIGRN